MAGAVVDVINGGYTRQVSRPHAWPKNVSTSLLVIVDGLTAYIPAIRDQMNQPRY